MAFLRCCPGLIIEEQRLKFVHANAGVDQSNIARANHTLLLPEKPSKSYLKLRGNVNALTDVEPPLVLINDSFGRARRDSITDMTIGYAGFAPLVSRVGEHNLFGRELAGTEISVANELAAAASHQVGQEAETVPVVLVRGAKLEHLDKDASTRFRERRLDWFRYST